MMLTFFINSFYNMKNILNLKERGRSSVGRYHTKQQTLILEYLALKKDTAFTAESVWRGLLGVEESWPSHCLPCVGPLGGGGHDSQNSLWGWQPGTLPLYGGSSPPLQRADGLPGLRTGISSGVLPSRGTDPAYSERPPI